MVLAALAAVSFFLALVGIASAYSFGIPTPGFLAVSIIPRDHGYSTLFTALALQAAVDWLFWFAFLYLVDRLIARRRSKAV